MQFRTLLFASICGWSLIVCPLVRSAAAISASETGKNTERSFVARGLVRELSPADNTVTIQHGAIPGFMDAMTMPFRVKEVGELKGLHPGDEVSFRLHVTATDSWVDHLVKTGTRALAKSTTPPVEMSSARPRNPLLGYKFTNELGRAVSFNDFRGQALAVTFIYTRCPLPNYCPRLSKDFEEASEKLLSLLDAPTNWHFFSVTFDPVHDTPEVLKVYGERYHYDAAHWSFLTGPPDKIGELARDSGVNCQSEGGFILHNFRTLIIDATGHLQMVFPSSGNISDGIVEQILKAAAATNTNQIASR